MEPIQAPWLPRTAISRAAEGLLTRYAAFTGRPAAVPTPEEALVEYLGLTLVYENLAEVMDVEDALGATWTDHGLIMVDEGLLDGVDGRRAFTVAHEIGHWELHRRLLPRSSPDSESEPAIFCRERDARLPLEWQADYFAACLLMPEPFVREAFESSFGPAPLEMYNRKSAIGAGFGALAGGAMVIDPALDAAYDIAAMVIDRGGFTNVSRTAMRIRLEELGLLVDRTIP